MPRSMEVGLSPVDFMLDGDPTPLPKKAGGSPQLQRQPRACIDIAGPPRHGLH